MDAIKRVAKERKIPKGEVYKEYHEGRWYDEANCGTWKSRKGIWKNKT
jgi:hypothetical protein